MKSFLLKAALDRLLQAYTPETTLNDINLILSIVMAKEELKWIGLEYSALNYGVQIVKRVCWVLELSNSVNVMIMKSRKKMSASVFQMNQT